MISNRFRPSQKKKVPHFQKQDKEKNTKKTFSTTCSKSTSALKQKMINVSWKFRKRKSILPVDRWVPQSNVKSDFQQTIHGEPRNSEISEVQSEVDDAVHNPVLQPLLRIFIVANSINERSNFPVFFCQEEKIKSFCPQNQQPKKTWLHTTVTTGTLSAPEGGPYF